MIETTDCSSATEDGFNEPDEAAFRIAKNLSEEVCDLQDKNTDHKQLSNHNTHLI